MKIDINPTILFAALLMCDISYCQRAIEPKPADSMMTPAPAPAPAPAPYDESYIAPKKKKNDGWSFMYANSSYRYSYKNKKRTEKGTVKVWVKQVISPFAYDEQESIKREHSYEPKYAKFSHTLTLYEFDCKNDKLRTISSVDYDDEGNVLRSFDDTDSKVKWDTVIPDSRGELIFKFFCQ